MGTTTATSDQIGTRGDADRRAFEVALLAGLAGVFIVNAVVAWLQPDDFVELVRSSVLSKHVPIEPGRWLAWAICVDDLALGVLLVASLHVRRWRQAVLAWSGLWLLAVTVVKLTSLDALGG
jgi:hypothetical protein